jgi:hypothetical protein
MGGGGKGGGGSDTPAVVQPTITPSPYETSLANISNSLWKSTDPVRSTFLKSWEDFLNPTVTLREGATPQSMIPQYSKTPATTGIPAGWQDIKTGQIYGKDLPGTAPWLINNNGSGEQLYEYQPANLEGGYGQNRITLRPYGETPGTAATQQITGYTPQYAASDYVTQQFNPSNLPGYNQTYDISRRGLEAQYNTAIEQARANTPRGGAMSDALNKLNLGRAESIGQLPSQVASPLIQDQLNKAYGAVFNAPSQAISGLSAANQGYVSSQNALLNAQVQQGALSQQASNSSSKSGLGMLGSGLGTIVGSAGSALGGMTGKGLTSGVNSSIGW